MFNTGEDGSNMLAQVDEKNNAVCIINSSGIIQMANKMLQQQYGYKKGELEGKNVSILMPNPFSGRHNSYLRNYLTTGGACAAHSGRQC
jgi:PAS domain S-box-containing protein